MKITSEFENIILNAKKNLLHDLYKYKKTLEKISNSINDPYELLDNKLNSWEFTNYNNTNGNINLWRININNATENKILKIVGGVLDWANDNVGVSAPAVAFWNLTPEINPTYTFDSSLNWKTIMREIKCPNSL